MSTLIFFLITVVSCSSLVALVYLFLKKQGDKDVIKLRTELHKQRQEFFLPSRLDAYQRSVLLLERIHPNSLIMRIHDPNMNAAMFQAELVKSVRNEFEHNLAQQIFISTANWDIIRNSKDEVIKLIHMAGSQMNKKSTSKDLSEKIFEILAQVDDFPTSIAVKIIKKEFQELF
ncbi:MAG: hypothetical protein P8P80_08430 [Crocinitomicaceae bacterium]|nr:hypothetical protein [Crocinitomicaceae bacterium]MDG1735873.1 hypothetical protein [Crocinitomicaceae bacterium]